MTKNVIQVRMPRWLIEGIEKLVRGGVYKNRGEVVVDAVRHFLGGNQKKRGIGLYIKQQLMGKSRKTGCSREEIEGLWEKLGRVGLRGNGLGGTWKR